MRITNYRIAIIISLTLMAPSMALGQRPPGGGPPGDGPQGDGRRGGPPDRRPHPGMQGPPPPGPRGPQGPPFGPQADWMSSEFRFGDRLVKGAPYSAEFTTESVQTLGDGTRITRKSNGNVYRNSEGRTRREQILGAIGPIAIEGEPPHMAFINDPIMGVHYAIDLRNRTARKLPFRENPPPPPLPSDFQEKADPVQNENLGKQVIEGVQAEGTRSTITIPAGRVGNDRPLEIVSERWYSPELQIVVLSKHKDPFAGENTYRLTHINREEPPLSLFEVPEGFRVEEGPPPDADGRRRPRPPRPE
jgi:hypothetical protein